MAGFKINNAINNTVGGTNPGVPSVLMVQNPDNTSAASDAATVMTVGGTSAGDAYLQTAVGATRAYSWGADTSAAGQPLQINTAAAASVSPSTGTMLWNMNNTGQRIMPLQPAFYAYLSANAVNATGDGTLFTIPFDVELYDQSNSFNNAIGRFTAPITGIYLLGTTVSISGVGGAHTGGFCRIDASGTHLNSTQFLVDPANTATGGALVFNAASAIPMTAGDTCDFDVEVSGGAKTITVQGGFNPGWNTYCWGFLVC